MLVVMTHQMNFVTRTAEVQKQLLLAFWNHHFGDAYTFHYFLTPTLHLHTVYKAVISKPQFPPVQNGNKNRVYSQEPFEGLT